MGSGKKITHAYLADYSQKLNQLSRFTLSAALDHS